MAESDSGYYVSIPSKKGVWIPQDRYDAMQQSIRDLSAVCENCGATPAAMISSGCSACQLKELRGAVDELCNHIRNAERLSAIPWGIHSVELLKKYQKGQ